MQAPASFGQWLKERRKTLDLTQDSLARHVGCALITIKKIEADTLRPSRQIVERLATVLEIPAEERATFIRMGRANSRVDDAALRPSLPARPSEARSIPDRSHQIIKGYELLEPIGVGGFGAVYRAQQIGVGRDVAIKIILPQLSNHPDFVRRFETEAQFVARLEHPHIVPLYDYWRDGDGAYLVMRFVRGGSLQAALKAGAWSLNRVTRLLDQIALALAFAHRQEV